MAAKRTRSRGNPLADRHDNKFVNECFDSLAADDPIYVEHNKLKKITCMEYLLNVPPKARGNPKLTPSSVNMYQFGRDDIDFTNPYCNGDDGTPIDCIARICEFHTSNASREDRILHITSVGAPKNHPDAAGNMSIFFTRYHDFIKGSRCETIRGERLGTNETSSCLNKLIEADPYFGAAYHPYKEDLEFTGCSTVIEDHLESVPCMEKIIIEALQHSSGSYRKYNSINYQNAKRLLTDFISRGDKEYKFNNEILTSRPIGDPLGYPTYIDMLTDTSLRVSDKEVTRYVESSLFYGYILGAAGHKYNVPGAILDGDSNFCRDRETRDMIPCLDKMLVESINAYNNQGSRWLTSIRDLVENPYFAGNPCTLLSVISKYTPKYQYESARSTDMDTDPTPGELLQELSSSIKKIVNEKNLMCPSFYSGDQVPIKEYSIELAVPLLAIAHVDKGVQTGKVFSGDCTSIDGDRVVTCLDKMTEMLSLDHATYGKLGASSANFILVDYAMRTSFKSDRSLISHILDRFNEDGVKTDGKFKENWGELIDDIIDFRGDAIVGNTCSDGRSVLQHVILDLGAMVDKSSASSVEYYEGNAKKVINLKGLSETDKKFIMSDVFPTLEPQTSLKYIAKWISEKSDDPLAEEMCSIMKSKSDWVSALTASEKIRESSNPVFQTAYEKCFGVEYPKAFGYTEGARKIFDYLCFSKDDLDESALVQSIIGIERGKPDSIDVAYMPKRDEYGILGVYDVNTKESWNEEEIEKYVNEVHKLWYGSDNKHGLYQLFHRSDDYHRAHPPLITNVGTRDNPVPAYVAMSINPNPEIEYHDLFRTVDDVRVSGDFEITLHYISSEGSQEGMEITKFKKTIKFANIITDLPKNVRNHISKTKPELFNKMQNVANAVRVKKPSEGQYKLVISNKSADLARCTSCQPWGDKSCLNLYSGCYRGAVKTYAHFGSYVAYLVKDSPYEPQWLGRLLIHKCRTLRSNDSEFMPALSIQDAKQHYTTKPRYWGIIYDAVRTIFADKHINEGAKGFCNTFAWANANEGLVDDYRHLCDEEVDSIIEHDADGDIERCIDSCMENEEYDSDDEDDENRARDRCADGCEQEIRDNFNCEEYLEDYFEDNDEGDDNPLYVSYVDTSAIQRISPGDSTYNSILKQRINDTSDSGKFIQRVTDTF